MNVVNMTGSLFENFIVTIARALYIKIQYTRSGNTKWVNLRNIIFTEFGVVGGIIPMALLT